MLITLGYKIKLLGFSEQINNKYLSKSTSNFIKNTSYVATIDGVLNAVIVEGSPVGQSIIQGEGCGTCSNNFCFNL